MIYEIVPLKFVLRQIDPAKVLFFDVETDGLYGDIMLAQFMQTGWEEALLVERPDTTLLSQLVNNSEIVAHTVSYELSCTNTIPEKFHCTQMAGKLHFFKEDKMTLDQLYTYALRYDPYVEAGLDKKVMQKTNWAGTLTPQHYLYAAIDVYYLPEVWAVLEPTIQDDNYKLDIITIKHCQELEKRGLPLLSLVQEQKITIKEGQDLEAQLPMNPRSPTQVAKIMGMTDGTGADKLAVLEAQGGDRGAMATMIRQARVLSKYDSTYLKKMVGRSRWYGHFAPRTKSGRLASSDNNLQNLPRKMKKFIGFEAIDDRVIISVDYAQLELRTIAAITGDTTMVKLFQEGVDVHGYVAEMLFGKDYSKDQRYIAKTANFSLLYGASAKTFAAMLLKATGIAITESAAQVIKTKWLATWKGIASWQQTAIKSWKAGNYWFTPMGRKYKAKMMTDFMNIRNQGAGGEVAKLGFNYIMKGFDFEDAYMINFVHDSFLAECPNDPKIYEPIAQLFADSLQESWVQYGKVVDLRGIPMPVDVGVALNWADADGMSDDCLYKIERRA